MAEARAIRGRNELLAQPEADGKAVAEQAGGRPGTALSDPSQRLAPYLQNREPELLEGRAHLARRRRYGRIAWFCMMVVLPTLAAAVYYFGIAADQYVAEFRSVVHGIGDNTGRMDAGSALQAGAGASQFALDSNVVVQYIRSRELVEELEKNGDLRRVYGNPAADFWARFPAGGSIEDLVDYWNGMAEPFFDLTTGTITVKVKAFTRDDAQRVAQKIIGLAEALVNGISLRALRDAVRSNEEEVAQAAEKMRRTRAAVLEFRNRQQLLDPKKEGDERILLMGKMQEQLAKAKTELATLRATMAQDAPTLKVMRHRVTAIEQQIKSTQTQMTSPDIGKTDVLSRSISGDQALATEQLLAEKSYDSALTSLERARALADRQITYLAVFVQPSRPQTAAYPRRAQAIFLTFLGGLGGWLMGLVLYRSVREHI